MIIRNKKLIPPFLLVLGLLAATTALAQEEEKERWYRVELLIFSHESSTASDSEQWNPTPSLAYPGQGRFLIDPQRVTDNLALYDATSTVDALGHQTLTIIPPPAEDEDEAKPLAEPEPITPADEQQPPDVVLATTPSPFIQRPHSELEFRGKAAYMQRTGRYQTLFHETWVQPMVEQGRTLPIIIDRSGDTEAWPPTSGQRQTLPVALPPSRNQPVAEYQRQLPAPGLGHASRATGDEVADDYLSSRTGAGPGTGDRPRA